MIFRRPGTANGSFERFAALRTRSAAVGCAARR